MGICLMIVICFSLFGQSENFTVAKMQSGQMLKTYDFSLQGKLKMDDQTPGFSPVAATIRNNYGTQDKVYQIALYQIKNSSIELSLTGINQDRDTREINVNISTTGKPFRFRNKEPKKLNNSNKKIIIPIINSGRGKVVFDITSLNRNQSYRFQHQVVFHYEVVAFTKTPPNKSILHNVQLYQKFKSPDGQPKSRFNNRMFNQTVGITVIRQFTSRFKEQIEKLFVDLNETASRNSNEDNLASLAQFCNPMLKDFTETVKYINRAQKALNSIERKDFNNLENTTNLEEIEEFENKYKNIPNYVPIVNTKPLRDIIIRGDADEKIMERCKQITSTIHSRKITASSYRAIQKDISFSEKYCDFNLANLRKKLKDAEVLYSCRRKLEKAKKESDIQEKLSLLRQVKDNCSGNQYEREAEEILGQYQLTIVDWKALGKQRKTTGDYYWTYSVKFENGNDIQIAVNDQSSEIYQDEIHFKWIEPDKLLEIIVEEFKGSYTLRFECNESDVRPEINLTDKEFKATLNNQGEEIVVAIESEGIPPYTLKFYAGGNTFYHRIKMTDQKTTTVPLSEIGEIFQGEYKVQLIDNYGRTGENIINVSLQTAKRMRLWMYLIAPTLLLIGFLFYRNVRFKQA